MWFSILTVKMAQGTQVRTLRFFRTFRMKKVLTKVYKCIIIHSNRHISNALTETVDAQRKAQ